MSAEQRLAALGIELGEPRAPGGAYVPTRRAGSLMMLSGQITDRYRGIVGVDLDLDQARLAARDCAINLLTQTRAALGSLDQVLTVVKLTGFVACREGFVALGAVVDGASELFLDVFADRGRHARSAVGVSMLPRGAPVEIEAILEVS